MLKIVVPANVMVFMKALLPITQYDYLEPYWSKFLVNSLKFDEDGQQLEVFGSNQAVTDQILTLGYENQCSLLNLGSISFFLNFYFLKVGFFYLVMTPLRRRFPKRYTLMRKNLFFSDLIFLVTEGFMEMAISGYLTMH